MCLAVSALLGIAQTATQFIAESQAANAQNEYAALNAQSANEAAILKYTQELSRQREEAANAARQRQNAYLTALNNQGTALASSQNEGNSTNLTLLDLARQGAREMSLIDENQKIQKQQGKDNLYAIQQEAQSRINGVQQTSGPSILGAAISGLGAVLSAKTGNGKHPYSTPMGKKGENASLSITSHAKGTPRPTLNAFSSWTDLYK